MSFAPPESGTLKRILSSKTLIENLLKHEPIDLVATHFALYAIGAIRSISKVPLVVHFHGPWAAESIEEGKGRLPAWGMKQIEKAVYRRADRVIVLSKSFAEVATKMYGVSAERIRIVPGSVDVDRFGAAPSREEARRTLGWPLDKNILLAVRRLSKRMGLDRLISAMPLILSKAPDTVLYLGGAGHIRADLETQIATLGLAQNVKMLGFVPDESLPLAYAAANFNVVPTLAWEGFGLTAIEALAAGTPSLVTPVGGLPEAISGLSTDLIFASRSVEDIASGIVDGLLGRSSIPSGRECKAYAASRFSSQLMAQRTAAVYREIQ
jgi:glycosyltransferase involved in cell wall biosynthesis